MENQAPTASGASFYNNNGQNHNSQTLLRKGQSHTHAANPSSKANTLSRNHPPQAAGNYSRIVDDKTCKYSSFNSSMRYENRDIISNEIRSRLKPTSNPDTLEHTKEYQVRQDNLNKDEGNSGVKYNSVTNVSPGKASYYNEKQEDNG